MTVKRWIQEALHNPNSSHFRLVNDFFAGLTLLSILVAVLETVKALEPLGPFLTAIEYISVTLFTAEYLARLYEAPIKHKYIFSFFGVVDLLAIIPTYLNLTNLTFLKAARILRILRFLRMMRLVKIARSQIKAIEDDENPQLVRLNIQIYIMTMVAATVFLGSLIYIFENHENEFANVPLSIYWVFKVILGDLPASEPTTLGGEVVLVITRFVSLLLFGLLLNVVSKMIENFLLGVKEARPRAVKKKRRKR